MVQNLPRGFYAVGVRAGVHVQPHVEGAEGRKDDAKRFPVPFTKSKSGPTPSCGVAAPEPQTRRRAHVQDAAGSSLRITP